MKLKRTIAILLSMLMLSSMLMACGSAGGSNLSGTNCEFVSVATNGEELTLAQLNGLGQSAPSITFDKTDATLNSFGGVLQFNYKKASDTSYTVYIVNEETKEEVTVGKITISGTELHILFQYEGISNQEYVFNIVE